MSKMTNRKAGGQWKSTRHDKWYNLAKEQGYRSRAAFKLIQINKKYDLLSSTKACLDLCAAPGGWLQVAAKYMPVSSLIIGIDLLPIRPMKGVTTIQGDITTPECRTQLKKELQGWDVDLVLHDGAPNVAGGQMWTRDAYIQNELVLHSLRLATQFLRPDGNFVTKVFRSQDYNALLYVLKQLFRRVEVCKPMASRDASAEIFVVCLGYLAPKKIDPQLLNPSQVFQQFNDADNALPAASSLATSMQALSAASSHSGLAGLPNYVDVFKAKQSSKSHRSRSGYDDVAIASSILSRTLPAHTFVNSDDPVVLLGTLNSLTFTDDASKLYLSHAKTTSEITSLCEDLKVLGKGDLKVLMRWRKHMRDWRKKLEAEQMEDAEAEAALAVAQAGGDDGEDGEEEDGDNEEQEEEEDDEAKLTHELRELRAKRMLQLKKDRRKKHELKMKALARLQLNKNAMTEASELVGSTRTSDDQLFSLALLPNKNALDVLNSVNDEDMPFDQLAGSDDEVYDSEDGAGEEGGDENGSGDQAEADSDDESSYMRKLERDLDVMYERYKSKRKQAAARAGKAEEEEVAKQKAVPSAGRADFDIEALANRPNKKRKRADEDDSDDDDGSDDDDDSDNEDDDDSDDEDDEDDEEAPANPLLVGLGKRKAESATVKMNRWFQRDLFAELDAEDAARQQRKTAAAAAAAAGSSSARTASQRDVVMKAEDGDDDESSSDDEDGASYTRGDDGDEDEDDEDEGKKLPTEDPITKAFRERRLVGATSVSKSRAQLADDARREKLRAKRARRNERRAQRDAANGVENDDGDAVMNDMNNDDDLGNADDDLQDVPHVIDQDSKKKAKKMARLERRRLGLPTDAEIAEKKDRGFEEVPMAAEMSSDDEAVSQTLALGHHLLDKRKREDMFDSTYNRYTYDDEDLALPAWFREDERRHSIIQLPITKQEVDVYREQLKMINARPIRKIAEAKARKAHRTEARWEKIKKQAEAIEKDESKSMNDRLKQIESLYFKKPKSKTEKKKDRVYQVVRKGGGSKDVKMNTGNKTGRVVKVDPRMKKDKRGKKNAEKRQKRKKTTANKRRRKV